MGPHEVGGVLAFGAAIIRFNFAENQVAGMSEEEGADMAEDLVEQDRRLVAEADKLIPKSQSAIERANEVIAENERALEKLREEREERLGRERRGRHSRGRR